MTERQLVAKLEQMWNESYQHKHLWRKSINYFQKLTPKQRNLAREGIIRHIKACDSQDILIDSAAITEIIMDARDNRQIWKESDKEFLTNVGSEPKQTFYEKLYIPSSTI